MEDKNIYNFTLEVESEERIDKLLARHFFEYSRSTIQKWISEKNVKIDNIICSQKDRIKSTCEVSIHITSTPEIIVPLSHSASSVPNAAANVRYSVA